MVAGILKVATCQFAVSSSMRRNAERLRQFMHEASQTGAEIVHFSECALSGYAGTDFKTWEGYDWELLTAQTKEIMSLAGELGLWVVLGSTHRLTQPHKSHNCLYLVDPEGKIVDRYDKRFCTKRDLQYFTPGNRFVYFTINGVKCSLLICFDLRFPEIYRELYKQKVNCIFQSFYNARQKEPSVHTHIMRQTMQCRAATNHFWVSMANASGYYSPYPSCFMQPDGQIVCQLKMNRPGFMVNTIDLNEKLYDPMAPFRDMAIAGVLNNGPKRLDDPRSKDTTSL